MRRRRVFGMGETVLDIIFKNQQPVGAKAGGSVLNSLISLARAGEEVYFISDIGRDMTGDFIINFLTDNKVNTDYIYRYADGQSPLALAFLNEKNDASYQFYKPYPPQRQIIIPIDLTKDDIVLIASFFAINPIVKPWVDQLLRQAKQVGALVYYDPNFRASHVNETGVFDAIFSNMAMADIVRGSDDDFRNILQAGATNDIYNKINHLCSNIIVTRNAEGVDLQTSDQQTHIKTPAIQPVSTIGAGDNFNAGFIKGLINLDVDRDNIRQLTVNQWKSMISTGILFASEVCQSLDNYISIELGNKSKSNTSSPEKL
jgi:fructokinase